MLDVEHRRGEHERDEDRPSLRSVVFPCGGGPPEREREDPRGGRGGVGRSEEAGHMGHGPGGDRDYIFTYLLRSKLRFLIRVRGDRGLRTAQGVEPAIDLARSCPMLFCET